MLHLYSSLTSTRIVCQNVHINSEYKLDWLRIHVCVHRPRYNLRYNNNRAKTEINLHSNLIQVQIRCCHNNLWPRHKTKYIYTRIIGINLSLDEFTKSISKYNFPLLRINIIYYHILEILFLKLSKTTMIKQKYKNVRNKLYLSIVSNKRY